MLTALLQIFFLRCSQSAYDSSASTGGQLGRGNEFDCWVPTAVPEVCMLITGLVRGSQTTTSWQCGCLLADTWICHMVLCVGMLSR